jgi:folate-binding protein YgfZ
MKEAKALNSELMAEYAAVRDGGVGLIDLSARGRIGVSGSEAVQFLNGLVSNDVKALGEDRWMAATFPNVQGRLLAAVRMIRRGEEILIDTEASLREKVSKIIERFTLAGDFRVKDLTDEISMISLQGRGASKLVELISAPIPATHTGEEGFDLLIDTAQKPVVWQRLVDAGAKPISEETLEILRVEAGIPRYGVDMDDSNVVPETNLDDAVSYTKGCYLGQEIIVRIAHRGHVAKKLTRLRFAEDVKVEPGAVIKSEEGKEIGRVTSAVFSPRATATVGLGYVRYEYLQAGTKVFVGDFVAEIES